MFCPSCAKVIPKGTRLCLHCWSSVQDPNNQKWQLTKAAWFLLGVVITLAAVFGMRALLDSGKEPARQPHIVQANQPASLALLPVADKLTSGQLVVRAGKYIRTKFTVDTEKMQDVHVVGSFRASGDSDDDIQVVLAEESEFENWINGHEARAIYTSGKTTTGNIDVQITKPGTYLLVFGNTFSLQTDKNVFAEVELQYMTLR